MVRAVRRPPSVGARQTSSRPAPPLVAAALLGAAALVALPTAGTAQEAPERLALVGGMLLDGYEAPPIHHAAVLVEDGRIAAVGPRSEVEIPPDARVIDTRGRTMLPGLVDLHVHTMILGHGNYAEWWPFLEGREREVMEISARQLLMAGVTTAVDLGAPMEVLEVRDRIAAGEVPGPRLLVSGPWITRRPDVGGVVGAGALGRLPDYFQRKIDTPEEAARAARELIDAGVDVIKVWAGMTEEDMRAVVRTAHERGVQVHAHLYDPRRIRAAIRAGVDVLQHVGSGGNPPYDEELIREIAHRSLPVVQTMAHRVWIYPATIEFPERLEDPRLERDFPPDIWRAVRSSLEDFHRLPYFQTTPRQIRNSRIAARQFIEANVVSAMGTDSGTPMNFHTESAWREIAALVESGMTPLEAISASTKTGAEVLGIAGETGTIEAGKAADVIVVEGNPLSDIEALADVELVVRGGVVHEKR